ncbi:PH domain-containing protein [Pseudonocardia spinosispora]|uniref:PH domain-containing protein n=1 Tax=Pseudonocardia spinosispora TaxID=103441 RepID=UPI00040F4D19|nr:PH domain-containing protein [Pseudonocardia spinosispora]
MSGFAHSAQLDELVADDDTPWRRLDPRMLAVFPLKQAVALVPLAVVIISGSTDEGGWRLFGALAPPAIVVLIGAARWFTVRYRVGADRVELRSGLLQRQQRSVRRDRIRTVDLHASPLHRLFGLTVAEIGTGSGAAKEGRLSLDGVTTSEGELLRHELLDRSPDAAVPVRPAAPARDAASGHTVAELRLSWLRYAPLTTSGLVAVAAIVGTAFKISNDLGVNLITTSTVHQASDQLTAVPFWTVAVVLVVVVLLVSAVGSLAITVEGWWHYRLSREADRTLRLRRGLLTTRSLSIEQSRLRGAEVTAPLLLRLVGAARCAAVTTGLDDRTSSGGTLLPPAPTAEAHRVAAAALCLHDPAEGTAATLTRHPPAALRRRITRAALPAVVVVAVLSWLVPIWPVSVLVIPLAVLLGADRYRNLGHSLRREYLVIGYGSLVARRVALQRRGIIGWRIRQSPLQRWAGVVTLDAITAAGRGRYSVVDIAPERAVSLIERVSPGLL